MFPRGKVTEVPTETGAVPGQKLIDKDDGIDFQAAFPAGQKNPQGRGSFDDPFGCDRQNDRGGVIDFVQGVVLNNDARTDFPGFRSYARIEVHEVNSPTFDFHLIVSGFLRPSKEDSIPG